MRDLCLEKGPVTHAIVEFSKYDIVPMLGDRDRMLDDFTHVVDTARWICGGEVVEIESSCRRIMVPDINWIGATLYFDNGSSCYAVGNWTSGRRIFRATIHAPGICADVELEKEAYVYTEGDYIGIRYDSKEVAGSDELFVYGGFQKKSREFVDSIIAGKALTSSPFSDVLKTMEVCETILAQARIQENKRYQMQQPEIMEPKINAGMERASKIRWAMLSFALVATILNYVDRLAFNYLSAEGDLRQLIPDDTFGYIGTAFFVGYMISNLVSGFAIDKLGLRLGYSLCMAFWTTATILQSLATLPFHFGIFRALLGVGEAGNWPAAIKLTSEWFPPEERSTATGIFNSGAAIGAMIAPPLIAWLGTTYGWRRHLLSLDLSDTYGWRCSGSIITHPSVWSANRKEE